MKRTPVITMILTSLLGVSIATNLTITRANAAQTSVTNQSNVKTLKTTVPPVYVSYWNTWRHVQLTKPIKMHIGTSVPYVEDLGYFKSNAVQTLKSGTNLYIRWFNQPFYTYKNELEIQFNKPIDNAPFKNYQNTNVVKLKKVTDSLPVKLIHDDTNANNIKTEIYKPTNIARINHKWQTGVYSYKNKTAYLFRTDHQYYKYMIAISNYKNLTPIYNDPNSPKQKALNQKLKLAIKPAIQFKNRYQKVLVKDNFDDLARFVIFNHHTYYTSFDDRIDVNNTALNNTNTIQSTFAPTKKNAKFIRSQYQIYDYTGEKWQVGKQIWQYNGQHWQKIK